MKIKTLRASGRRVQADVVIGSNQYGSDVTVLVTLDRTEPDLIEALAPLQKLLSERASSYLAASSSELEIRTLVDQRVAKERERIKTDVERRLEGRIAQAERAAEDMRRLLEIQKDANTRLRERNRELEAAS